MKGARNNSPIRVATVAGHDPSGGAGFVADCKVFEQLGVQGYSVCTALTVQSSSQFISTGWQSWEQIQSQLEAIVLDGPIHFWKIGLVQNASTLNNVVQWIRKHSPSAFILWDPILKASAGFSFHDECAKSSFQDICANLSLITPNAEEAHWLGNTSLSILCLVKGGHKSGDESTDVLYQGSKPLLQVSLPRIFGANKHGTGCILSASIVGHLALGHPLAKALLHSRLFLQKYLKQESGLLGFVHLALNSIAKPQWPELYAITWEGSTRPLLTQVDDLCKAGVGILQLRMKNTPLDQREGMARKALEICRTWGVTLVINDDVALALLIGAPAIHLGLQDMPIREARQILGESVWIGGTANTLEQVQQRIQDGADLVGLGPYRHTGTKQNLSPVLGLDGIHNIVSSTHKVQADFPIYCIGGIQENDIESLLSTGVRGVAISSAIVCAPSIELAVQGFQKVIDGQGVLT